LPLPVSLNTKFKAEVSEIHWGPFIYRLLQWSVKVLDIYDNEVINV